MSTQAPAAPEPTDEQCSELLSRLGLSYTQAHVSISARELIVHIHKRQKKPTITEWAGWPVIYRIGGGMPRAFAA